MSDEAIAAEVERYLRSGDTDAYYVAWPGGFLEGARRAREDLRGALVREVHRRARGRSHRCLPQAEPVELTRIKIEPMVRGLFPRAEQEVVLAALEKSVVFVTSVNIERLLLEQSFDESAWTLANLYLDSVGADLLGPDALRLVGLSQETTCYVSPEYFGHDDPFADFIVHEVAHIFHNCKRAMLGLRQTRTKEWLIDIEFRKRETFAYACEAYARVLERGRTASERRALAAEYRRTAAVPDEQVESDEVGSIVVEAANARNGWKVILARCAPRRRPRTVMNAFGDRLRADGANPE